MMARTSADRQSAYRARLAEKHAGSEAELERLRALVRDLERRLAASEREVEFLSARLDEAGSGEQQPAGEPGGSDEWLNIA